MRMDSRFTSIACPLLVASAMLPALVGCGDSRPARVPISGQVLIDGEPLKFGVIRFIPDDGRPSSGNLDANGRFTLSCFDDDDGAVLGHHKVAIFANEALDDRRTRWHAPPKYASLTNSGLEQQITEANQSLTIKLTWDGGKPFTDIDRSGEDDPKGLKQRTEGKAATENAATK
jgi:hypothetical protein